jgi:hypothetical protein
MGFSSQYDQKVQIAYLAAGVSFHLKSLATAAPVYALVRRQ